MNSPSPDVEANDSVKVGLGELKERLERFNKKAVDKRFAPNDTITSTSN